MNRFFAVLFSKCGFRWAKSWLAGIDEKVLIETINALRLPNGSTIKVNSAVVLDDVFYKTSEYYQTADTMAKERAANHAARNAKAHQDAEIGLVKCAEMSGMKYLELGAELQEIAERHGLFGVKKRNSKPLPTNEVKVNDERKTDVVEDWRTFDSVPDGKLDGA